ncbi:MAG: glutamate-1-semialdehyde 2,1-aminomutase [Phycisphaeraceae bacterium]
MPVVKTPKTKIVDRYAKSRRAWEAARTLMPGGVSSPVRAYKAVGHDPIVIKQGKGCKVTDIDGNEYIDYVMSYGPLILGHCPDHVTAAITKTARRGASFGMPTEAETELAELVVEAVQSIELVRFVNSGTEATMSALRLARAATERDKIIKCRGCYHGHADGLLVEAGSGATTLGVPSSPGVPANVAGNTVLVPFNDAGAVERVMSEHRDQIAAMIVEPIAGNMGCVPPAPGYLKSLRDLCDRFGVLLIFDEVMTGFRVGFGGAQGLFDVTPDLTCLGKVIGGGLPCAAYGGRENLMRQVSPDGPVYQAGTLSGNPLAMAAGIATLETLKDGTPYQDLEAAAGTLAAGLKEAAGAAGVAVQVQRVGSMLTPFFNACQVTNYEQACASDTRAFAVFFSNMLNQGVVLPPSQYEAWFVSTAHDSECISQTITAAHQAFEAVARGQA